MSRYLSQTLIKRRIDLLIVGVIAISFAAPLFKLSQPTHPLIAASTRLSFAALIWAMVCISHAYCKRIDLRVFIEKQLAISILCGLCYAVHFGAWVWSLGLTSVLASATLVTTTPIMLGFIGLLTGQDRPSPRLILGGLIAMVGVLAFGFDHQSMPTQSSGDLLALLGALAMVPYLLMTRRIGPHLQLAPFSLMTTSVGALCLWASAWSTLPSQNLGIPIGLPLYALIAAALIPQMIGHSALALSLKYFTPTEVGLATLLEPVGASILAWFLLNDTQSISSILASLVTLCGVSMTFMTSNTK